MRAQRVGIIGGGVIVATFTVLAGVMTVVQAVTIDDERGSAINAAPVVVGAAPLVALTDGVPGAGEVDPEVSEPAPVPTPEVVTAPEPRRAAPPPPVAPPPPAVEAPAPPQTPPGPQRPSDEQIKRWVKDHAIAEALAWAKEHGWTEEDLRAAMREYAPHFGGNRP